MAVVEIDSMLFLDGKEKYIIIESDRFEEYMEYIIKKKIKSIYLCNLYFKDNEIGFLEKIEFIENLNITCSGIRNFQVLQYLTRLRSLSIDEPEGEVDLTHNVLLRELSITMRKKVLGIDKLVNLKVLRMWNYNPKDKSLSELSTLSSLEELVITNSSIESLLGCGSLTSLRKLELNYLKKLCYIDEIEKLSRSLKILSFNSCKQIINHGYISCLNNLEKLSLNECGEIENINFIKEMYHLKWFVFMGTNVKDGNIEPCKRLEYVAFTNKKHFSHKNEDFK